MWNSSPFFEGWIVTTAPCQIFWHGVFLYIKMGLQTVSVTPLKQFTTQLGEGPSTYTLEILHSASGRDVASTR